MNPQHHTQSENTPIHERELMRYLNHEMNPEERTAFENSMKDDPFLEEAVTGLTEMNSREIETAKLMLEQTLKKQIKKEKKKTKNKQLLTPAFLSILIAIILFLIVIAWFLIHQLSRS